MTEAVRSSGQEMPYLGNLDQKVIWGNQTQSPEYIREIQEFNLRFYAAEKNINQNPPLLPTQQVSHYNKLNFFHSKLVELGNDLNKKHRSAQTHHEIITIDAIKTGIELAIHDAIRNKIGLLRKYGIGIEPTLTFLELSDFDATTVTIKIGEISFADFEKYNPKSNQSPVPFFEFLINTHLASRRGTYTQIVESNNDGLMNQYPHIALYKAQRMPLLALNTFQTDIKEIDTFASSLPPFSKQAIQHTKDLIEASKAVRQVIVQTIMDPKSPHFSELVEVVKKYLMGDRDEQIYALLTLGLNDPDITRKLYRTATKFSASEEGEDVYALLLRSMNKILDVYPSTTNMPTIDDVPKMLQNGAENEFSVPSMTEHGKTVGKIFTHASQREYTLDPENIPWEKLVEPARVTVVFGNKPKQFTITLEYEDEIGEKIRLTLSFDTEKQRFDWSFLEDPQDPSMHVMTKAAIAQTKIILDAIQANTTQFALQKEAERQAKKEQPVSQSRVKKTPEAYIPRPKAERALQPQAITPIMQALAEIQQAETKGPPKRTIILPDEENLAKLLAEVAEYDREKVIEEVKRFNAQGGSGFKALTSEGTPKYELKIGSHSAKKGIRVILLPSESEKGNQHFEIYGIWYRGETFKRHRKKKLDAI